MPKQLAARRRTVSALICTSTAGLHGHAGSCDVFPRAQETRWPPAGGSRSGSYAAADRPAHRHVGRHGGRGSARRSQDRRRPAAARRGRRRLPPAPRPRVSPRPPLRPRSRRVRRGRDAGGVRPAAPPRRRPRGPRRAGWLAVRRGDPPLPQQTTQRAAAGRAVARLAAPRRRAGARRPGDVRRARGAASDLRRTVATAGEGAHRVLDVPPRRSPAGRDLRGQRSARAP